MNAGDFALQVLAGGTAETVSVLPYAIAAAVGVLVITGTGAVLLFMGRARWQRIRGEVGDDVSGQYGRYDPDALAAAWQQQEGGRRG